MEPLRSPRPAFLTLAALLAAGAGCDREQPAAVEAAPPPPARHLPSPWHISQQSALIAVAPEDDPELAGAIRKARATLEEARGRWQTSRADVAPDAGGWAVKWAAPTLDGHIEHVWVEPITWSRFRIEGRLASPPKRELLGGASQGELVSFSVEDVSDWVHLIEGRSDGPREGGFTIEVLERRYGPPP